MTLNKVRDAEKLFLVGLILFLVIFIGKTNSMDQSLQCSIETHGVINTFHSVLHMRAKTVLYTLTSMLYHNYSKN